MAVLEIRQPLQFLLVKIGACSEAVEWARGRPLNHESWDAAHRDWRQWLVETLKCKPSFEACLQAAEKFSGSGSGSGSGDGYGSGYGDGDGSGYGYGYGDGSGDGSGSGSGSKDVVK